MYSKGTMMKKFCCLLSALVLVACPATAGQVIMTTSVFGESGNVAIYDSQDNTFVDNVLPLADDNWAVTDGTYLYILERSGADAVSKYLPSDISAGRDLYQFSLGAGANPYDMVFYGSKAYILLYGTGTIWVVKPDASDETSFKIGEIDVSGWADGDGSSEPNLGFVYNGMVYVALQRYDLTTNSENNCVIVMIDPQTDTIVGNYETSARNVTNIGVDGRTLYLAGTTYGKSDEGITVLNLDNLSGGGKKLVTEESLGGSLSGMYVLPGGIGIICSYDADYNSVPRYFDLITGIIGARLPVPDAGYGRDIVMMDGLLYIGSRNYTNPGLYIVDPDTNSLVKEMQPTELQPNSIVVIDGTDIPVDVERDNETPELFAIDVPFPNPFNPVTSLNFSLPLPVRVTVEVFGVTGQKIATLRSAYMDAGTHTITWNAGGLPAGLYFIRVTAGSVSRTVRAMLVK